MRVTREKAAENRDRIVDTASRLFRERGIGGIGVADLMQEAGLTHGGFYGHFESKDDLAVEACRRAFARSAAKWETLTANTPAPLNAVAGHYLARSHCDDPGGGCAHAALAADVARSDNAELRRTFTEGLAPLIATLTRAGGAGPKAARRKKALAQMAGMVGAVLLARAVDDPKLSDEILAAMRGAISNERT